MVDKDALDAVFPLGVEEADGFSGVADGDVDSAVPGLRVLVVAVFYFVFLE